MALDKGLPLHLGSARIRVSGRYVGQVSDFRIERDVAKAEHMTNVGVQFRRDAVLAIETRVGVGWTFGEIHPFNANLLLGAPGYRAIAADRKLSSIPMDVGMWNRVTPLIQREAPVFTTSSDGIPQWQPMIYPIISGNATALKPPLSVSAMNTGAPNPANTHYVGFAVSAGTNHAVPPLPMTLESICSNVAVVAHNDDLVAPGDAINLLVRLDPSHAAGNFLRVYRFPYAYDAATQTYYCTEADDATAHVYDQGADDDYEIVAGDVTAGYATLTVSAKMALVGATQVIPQPCTVTNWTGLVAYRWLDDYEVAVNKQGGSAIKRSPQGTISAYQVCFVNYYYDADQIAEAPIGGSPADNPVSQITAEVPMPDNQSKIIFHLWKVQMDTSMAFATSEKDWTGIPFGGDTLDASEVYPDFPYGYMQITGPLATRIVKGGNFPVLNGETSQAVLGQVTPWA